MGKDESKKEEGFQNFNHIKF